MLRTARYSLLAFGLVWLAIGIVLAAPRPVQAGKQECRARVAKLVGALTKKRARQITRCERAASCTSGELAARLARLRPRAIRRLLADCAGLTAADLGLGSTCPDPSGSCAQVLDSDAAIADCFFCMIAQTVDPLLRRLRGSSAGDAQPCGGCAATPCNGDLLCERPPGHCGDSPAAGVCIEPPSVCPDLLEPVCGCDDVTYGNNCLRRQAAVGLFHRGPCVTFCGGSAATSCPDGTVCDGLPGHCDATTDEGICVPEPDLCHGPDRPVCGCDGVTYSNNCERLAAGVRLEHFGPCRIPCSYDDSGAADCGPEAFCEQMPGVCQEPGSHGVCIDLPVACTDEYDPVCGCDHTTYSNDCVRRRAGVGRLHRGECEPVCGGITGLSCEPGQVCELPPGLCDGVDLQGRCVTPPELCPQVLEPVCGCDGATYANNCERLATGVQLAHFGPCRTACTPGSGDCEVGQVCLAVPGHCDDPTAPAACIAVPDLCPALVWPVCGCDGSTYESPCAAVQAGVSIAHPGECP